MSSTMSQPAMAPERPERALVPAAPSDAGIEQARPTENHGLLALGALDDSQFSLQLERIKKGMERLDTIIRDVLKEGLDADYATLPGTTKKDLLLPGVEKLLFLCRLVPTYQLDRVAGTGEPGSPRIHYACHCALHLGDASGPAVSSGVGTANSSEVKHRYRNADRECPSCHKVGTIFRSKYPAKADSKWAGQKGWYCFAKQGGCGAEFAPDDPGVTFQTLGRAENTEPDDLDNTLAKMSKTRAVKDATKTALAGSARFTQDVTDTKARVSPDDGRRVESSAEVVNERSALERELWSCAKARGMAKVADILTAMVQAGIISTTVTNTKQLTDKQIAMVLDIWRGELRSDADESGAEAQPTDANADGDIPF